MEKPIYGETENMWLIKKDVQSRNVNWLRTSLVALCFTAPGVYGAEAPLCSEAAANGQGYGSPFTVEGVTYRKVNEDWARNSSREFWCRVTDNRNDNGPALRISDVSYGGSGCPQRSGVSVNKIGNNVFSLDTSKMSATIDTSNLSEQRTFCQVNLKVQVPDGWSYSLDSVKATGYASLSNGASGSIGMQHYFMGEVRENRLTQTVNGPVRGGIYLHIPTSSSSKIWSPCGGERNLNVKFDINLFGNDARDRGTITLDEEKVLGFSVRKC
jgi:hypothetical protein